MKLLRRKPQSELDTISAALDGFELPSFPQVVNQALAELAKPDVDLHRVAHILETDPGLSVHFLRITNSAAFSLRSEVDSMDRAVAIMGRNQVESILIGRAVTGVLDFNHPAMDASRFWRTAATRAVVAAHVSAVLDPARRSEHFTAALLQDMALPVLADHVDGYGDLLGEWYDGAVYDLAETEMDRYGWTHAQAAGLIAEAWEFPHRLTDELKGHHDPFDGTPVPSRLVDGWHETDADRGPMRLFGYARRLDGLDEESIDAMMADVDTEVAAVAAMFG